jgi:uncharacterized protein YjbI with pentapeptide repeats
MNTSDHSGSKDDPRATLGLSSISREELEIVLKDHETWLDSKGKDGKRAMLEGGSLAGIHLGPVNLDRACLAGADLSDTVLTGASLRHTDLSRVKGLLGEQLAMADVTGAVLPESIAGFDGLNSVKEASQNARKLFFGMLLACGYIALTVATTDDLRLMTNSTSSPMPIIGSSIPIVYFYFSAPFLLVGLYCYLHLYQQRLWEGLAKLPAVFPDGRALNETAYPWLMNGLISRHFIRLKDHQPKLAGLQTGLSIFLSWWTVPLTLFFVWQRYLRRHDMVWTSVHVFMLVATMGAGLLFYLTAKQTLEGRGIETVPGPKTGRMVFSLKHFLFLLVVGSGLFAVSFGCIYNMPGFVFRSLQLLGFSANVNLSEAEISTPPGNFDRNNPDHLMFVKGAFLAGRNLRHAVLSHAFLVKADLRGADLGFADLRGANLMGAQLEGANLRGADLRKAKFSWVSTESNDGKYLWNAKMSGVDLTGADLRQAGMPENLSGIILQKARMENTNLRGIRFNDADLRGANLRGSKLDRSVLKGARLTGSNLAGTTLFYTDLAGADLTGVDFTGARFNSTNFMGSDLKGATGLTLAQLKGSPKSVHNSWPARNILLAHPGEALQKLLGFPLDHENRLAKMDFSGYSLFRADFKSADLHGASFRGADLRNTRFGDANFRDADLRLAILDKAWFESADLRGADLRQASLMDITWSTGTQLDLVNIYGVTRLNPSVRRELLKYGAVEIQDDDQWQGMKTIQQR